MKKEGIKEYGWAAGLIQEMRLRGFSQKTIKAYLGFVKNFIFFTKKSPREVCGADVRLYLETLIKNNRSSSTVNTAYSALRFYFAAVLRRKFFARIPRVKNDRRLPAVLSTQEARAMIEKTINQKHKCMLQLLYGTGMRVGELVRLRMREIDFDRGAIFIVRSKGAKDRITLLPRSLYAVLKKQMKLKAPEDYLFTKYGMGTRLTEATVQKIVKQAAARAGIIKQVTPHTLRHTFATHMLESGVDIRYIQKLLGHNQLKTTERYTHVADSKIGALKSPLDFNGGPEGI